MEITVKLPDIIFIAIKIPKQGDDLETVRRNARKGIRACTGVQLQINYYNVMYDCDAVLLTAVSSIALTTLTVPSTTPGQHGVPFSTSGSEDASASIFFQEVKVLEKLREENVRTNCLMRQETLGRRKTL
jgi:hypothetical protein